MLLIGSLALKHHDPLFTRESKDIDFICTKQEFQNRVAFFEKAGILKKVYATSHVGRVIKLYPNELKEPLIQEYTLAKKESSNEFLLRMCPNGVASLEVLLLLKLSHRYLKNSPHFLKTMQDIRYLRQKVSLTPELEAILKLRESETYTYDHPSLAQDKSSFFKKEDSFYVYDHDDLHKVVARLEKPAYLYFKPENSEVMVSKKLWDSCSKEIKLLAGLEESMVLALERSLIPAPGVLTPKQAFDKALEKVCTSITSGWFREFCWEHYWDIQALYNDDFVTKFHDALANNKVAPYVTRV